MNQHLQTLLGSIQHLENLGAEEKNSALAALKNADKDFEIISFKLDRTEKVKRTTAILLEETIEELERKRRAVEETLAELKATQAQLIQSEKMASLGELTAGIAHEIQNPLNFVNNFAEVSIEMIDEMNEESAVGGQRSAVRGQRSEVGGRRSEVGGQQSVLEILDDIKQNLDKILHHGKRADAIVKGMLQHSRISTGQKEPTDINTLADEYLRLSYHGLRAKDKSFNADFKTDFDENLPKINVIPQDIGRVLLNLINNAFYAVSMRNLSALSNLTGLQSKLESEAYKPTVTVSTKHTLSSQGESLSRSIGSRGEVLIMVKDNGDGIPESALDKIFQPFFTTKPTGQGTGLGLSLSYDIVKAQRGEILVETQESVGTTFIIQIPVTD
jgi:two-component system, NtrC family, sensor kinase